MVLFFLLVLGNILSATSGLNLNCSNDYDSTMVCHFDAQNCAEHNMTLHNREATESCSFSKCVRGCCCSIKMVLVYGETFEAKVLKRGLSVLSQTISIAETIKPQTPNITKVEKSNEIYRIHWTTNTKEFIRKLIMANVTYQKKGDNEKAFETVKPSTMSDLNVYEILGTKLEQSATYVVRVSTYTDYGVYSDSSNEIEFTTSPSQNSVLIIIVLCISVIAVITSAVAFIFFMKLKGNLWDKAAKDKEPRLLQIQPKKEEILVPESLAIYSLSVESHVSKDSLTLSKESLTDSSGSTGQTSGISTGSGSSTFSYANTEPADIGAAVQEALRMALPTVNAVSPLWPTESCKDSHVISLAATGNTQFDFDNESYSIYSHQSLNNDLENLITCDPGYHSSKGPTLHASNNPPPSLTIVSTDMLNQPCSKSEENLLLTLSGASSGLSTDSQHSLLVVYGYQAFQTEQPTSNTSGHGSEENLSEESQPWIEGLKNNTNNTEAGLSQAETTHMSSLTTNLSKHLIVDCDYQSV